MAAVTEDSRGGPAVNWRIIKTSCLVPECVGLSSPSSREHNCRSMRSQLSYYRIKTRENVAIFPHALILHDRQGDISLLNANLPGVPRVSIIVLSRAPRPKHSKWARNLDSLSFSYLSCFLTEWESVIYSFLWRLKRCSLFPHNQDVCLLSTKWLCLVTLCHPTVLL